MGGEGKGPGVFVVQGGGVAWGGEGPRWTWSGVEVGATTQPHARLRSCPSDAGRERLRGLEHARLRSWQYFKSYVRDVMNNIVYNTLCDNFRDMFAKPLYLTQGRGGAGQGGAEVTEDKQPRLPTIHSSQQSITDSSIDGNREFTVGE